MPWTTVFSARAECERWMSRRARRRARSPPRRRVSAATGTARGTAAPSSWSIRFAASPWRRSRSPAIRRRADWPAPACIYRRLPHVPAPASRVSVAGVNRSKDVCGRASGKKFKAGSDCSPQGILNDREISPTKFGVARCLSVVSSSGLPGETHAQH